VPLVGPKGVGGAAVAVPPGDFQRELKRGPRGVGGAGASPRAFPCRAGPAEGAVGRGVPGLDGALPGGHAVRLLVGGRDLYNLARGRRPPPVPAGHHRRHPRGPEGVGRHRRGLKRVHRVLAGRAARPQGTWPVCRCAPGRRRRGPGVLGRPGAGLPRDGAPALLVPLAGATS